MILRMAAVFAAVTALSAKAQDDDFDFGDESEDATEAIAAVDESSSDSDSAADESAEEGEDGEEKDAAKVAPKTGKDQRYFTSLPFCRKLVGHAEILKPGATEWTPVEEGKFYPLGSFYRTTDSSSVLEVQFGQDDLLVELSRGAASFGTHFQPIGQPTRTISLQDGVIAVKLPRNLPDGLFKITAPSFTVVNPKGESRYSYKRAIDGDVAQIRCVTGFISVEGRHFTFPELKAANEIKIRSSQDYLFTGLYGKSGDCLVKLDQGDKSDKDYATGETTVVRKPLDWKLSPKTAVRIYRALPAIGERMAVTVMTFDAAGSLKNRCAFVEGRPEVNSGELGPVAGVDRDAIAKKAAAAAETVESDVEIEEEPEEAATSDDSGADDSSSSDDSADGDDDMDF